MIPRLNCQSKLSTVVENYKILVSSRQEIINSGKKDINTRLLLRSIDYLLPKYERAQKSVYELRNIKNITVDQFIQWGTTQLRNIYQVWPNFMQDLINQPIYKSLEDTLRAVSFGCTIIWKNNYISLGRNRVFEISDEISRVLIKSDTDLAEIDEERKYCILPGQEICNNLLSCWIVFMK